MFKIIPRVCFSLVMGSYLRGMQTGPPQLTDTSAQVIYTRTLWKLRAQLQDATTVEEQVMIRQLIQDFASCYGPYRIEMPQTKTPLPSVLNISGELIAPVGPNDRNWFVHRQSTSAFKKEDTVPSPPPNSLASSYVDSDGDDDIP